MNIKKQKKMTLGLILPVIIAAFAWATIPFIQSNASPLDHNGSGFDNNVTTYYRASLTGSQINNTTPYGRADYRVFSNGSRRLEVNIYSVGITSGTVLSVFVNNVQTGQVTVSSSGSGRLRLSTNESETVPVIAAGGTLQIRQGTTVLLSGTFGVVTTSSPTPTVSPTSTVSPTPTTRFNAALTGTAISDAVPRGLAEYRATSASARLHVYISNVNLTSGTILNVFVGTTNVGQITLNSNRRGELTITTNVPTIAAGTAITVRNGATVILTGTFGTNGNTNSSATARNFEARLRGGNVVPAVTTAARGTARIILNEAETQIQVSVGFYDLAGAQTTATINGPAASGANGAVIFNLGTVGGTSGFLPVQTFTVTAAQVAQLRAGLWYVVVGTAANAAGEIRGQLRAHGRRRDFEGDGRADFSVFRAATGSWYFSNSSDGALRTVALGEASDRAVAGDFDGDGINDAAVFGNRNGAGVWTIRRSLDDATYSVQWGLASDKPVAGDFDGDGQNDLAVFRADSGTWYIKNSETDSTQTVQFGTAGDIPAAADFDGDGRADIAVFRPSDGVWYQLRSADNSFYAVQWGTNGDVPSVGDFDGDSRADVTVWRPSNGVWFTLRSSDEQLEARQFGAAGDIPVAGEFDSDENTDVAVFRPSNGFWYVLQSTDDRFVATQFGTMGDAPAGN